MGEITIRQAQVYRMLKYGQQYVDKGMDHYDQKYRDQQIQSLKKAASSSCPRYLAEVSGEKNEHQRHQREL